MANEAFVVDGKTIYVRYNRSFTARLVQSSDEVKARYSELKNLLVAYGAKARMSWTNETFRFGRLTVAKFGIKGKTLSLYLNLDPAEFEDSKYIFENAGDTKRYAEVPFRLKLRSGRGVKWGKELIDLLMARLGREMDDIAPEDYSPEYRTTEVLVHEGLIKVLVSGDGKETELEAATFEAMRREKFKQVTGLDIQESVTVEQAEAVMTNEMAASFIEDEADFVAEQTVTAVTEPQEACVTVEETASQAKEPSVAVEAPAATAVVENAVPQENAVPAVTVSRQLPKRQKSKPQKAQKEIVNIDAISRAFAAGDTVSLETMIGKGLVSKKTTSVKILARGKLDKPLTVIADVYSIQAVKMILLTGGRVIKRNHPNE